MNMRMVLLAAALAAPSWRGLHFLGAPGGGIRRRDLYRQVALLTLRQHVRLTRRTVDFNKNGFLQAQIEAVNLGRKDVQFQYRFRWLNEQKMLIPAATAIWKPVSVGARSTEYFTSTAPTTDARDFFMEVRFVHDSTRW